MRTGRHHFSAVVGWRVVLALSYRRSPVCFFLVPRRAGADSSGGCATGEGGEEVEAAWLGPAARVAFPSAALCGGSA